MITLQYILVNKSDNRNNLYQNLTEKDFYKDETSAIKEAIKIGASVDCVEVVKIDNTTEVNWMWTRLNDIDLLSMQIYQKVDWLELKLGNFDLPNYGKEFEYLVDSGVHEFVASDIIHSKKNYKVINQIRTAKDLAYWKDYFIAGNGLEHLANSILDEAITYFTS